jgi:glycolate oxidase FAD binding subunit
MTTAAAVHEPDTPEKLAAALADASRARHATIISGAGSKLDWGRRSGQVDRLIKTSRLNRIVAHRHGDLTATIQAGAALTKVNRQLAVRGQWLPIDTAFDEATIGGIVATNDAGPLRHRFGTPRDLLIGVTLALTDGRIVKAGGHVVKNVAGYDLGRLMSGSFGTLAAIVDATFKLLPVPAASQTVVAQFADAASLATGVAHLADTDLEPIAFDVHVIVPRGEYWLLARFATSPAATNAQVASARALLDALAGCAPSGVVSGAEEEPLWRDHREDIWKADGAVVRVSWMPASLEPVLLRVEAIAKDTGASFELAGRAGVGAGFVRIHGDDRVQIAAIEQLRASADVAHVVVLRASSAVKQQIDPWEQNTQLDSLYRALKHAFDPTGTLNREPRTSNREPRTSNREPRTSNREPRTSNREPGTSNHEPNLNTN